MGIAAGDYDANGTLDFFLTHAYNDTNSLHANRGGLVFEDVTRSNTSLVLQLVGVASHRNGWGDAPNCSIPVPLWCVNLYVAPAFSPHPRRKFTSV